MTIIIRKVTAPGGSRDRMPYRDSDVRREKDRDLHRRRRRDNPEHERALKRAYYDRHAAEIAARNLVARSKEREKAIARSMVSRALAKGELTKEACEVGVDCFGSIEAHHDDYNLPLDVRWICKGHHMQMHAINKSAA
jgi:hypothetical protein